MVHGPIVHVQSHGPRTTSLVHGVLVPYIVRSSSHYLTLTTQCNSYRIVPSTPITSISKLKMLGGYGPWTTLTSITNFEMLGGYRTMVHGPCTMLTSPIFLDFNWITSITKFKMLGGYER